MGSLSPLRGQPAPSQPVSQNDAFARISFTSRDSELVNVSLLECEQSEEPTVSNSAPKYLIIFCFAAEPRMSVSGPPGRRGLPGSQWIELCVVMHGARSKLGFLRLSY